LEKKYEVWRVIASKKTGILQCDGVKRRDFCTENECRGFAFCGAQNATGKEVESPRLSDL
jgi:hypothetical protein